MTVPIERAKARLSQVVMSYAHCGRGDAVVLLHGWPQTSHEWRHLMPLLGERYRVIAPDLRGLGDTSRPLDGYDSGTVAADVAELLTEHLGIERFHLVGHDWGGPTAFALAVTRMRAVATLTIIDVTIPGIGPDISQGGRRWHHAFHMTPDLPELLVQGHEREYLGWFYREFSFQPDAITAADVDEYLRAYTQPGALRAGFSYYRNIPKLAAQNRALLESGFRLPMPVLAVGGGRTESRGRGIEPEQSLREIAVDVTGAVIADSGHFVPEEQPEALFECLLAHLRRHPIG
ncbi:MAG TPA: alpha/beta hydrolase [Burkholderiaceae bacterium]|nr:alpha/beta hydrolase [Burkholderiaceae bacterium]